MEYIDALEKLKSFNKKYQFVYDMIKNGKSFKEIIAFLIENNSKIRDKTKNELLLILNKLNSEKEIFIFFIVHVLKYDYNFAREYADFVEDCIKGKKAFTVVELNILKKKYNLYFG